MICLHLSLSFKSLSIPFIVNHIYCHYKYTNDQRSSIIFICLQIYSHSYLLFSCMLLYTLLLLCLFIVHPHRYKHHTEEPPPFFSIQLDVSLVKDTEFFLLSRCLASISRTPMSSVRYTIVSLILTSRQHQHARSYISSTPSSF